MSIPSSPDLNPLTRLSLTMQAKKGTFALLLGSGISSAAHINTGWAITLDLIRRIAAREREDPTDHPDKWYEQKYGEEPGYSSLLDRLTSTPAERHLIIKQYIEPSEDDRENGYKVPTKAHRAIASLVARGYIRVIVTTNFDQLLETALRDVGVYPTVIAASDSIVGRALPLAHSACTIVKVHGDYLDANTKNTDSELSAYDPQMDKLLDQVFTEYGVIISGWSATWDVALRTALMRSISPWFSTYWSTRSEPNSESRQVIDERKATEIMSVDADEFFQSLEEGVSSVEDLRMSELLSASIAESSLKRYIHDPIKLPRLRDMIIQEANRVRKSLEEDNEDLYSADVSTESIEERFQEYNKVTEVLRSLYISGCYWGGKEHVDSWVLGLSRLVTLDPVHGNRSRFWSDMRYYAAIITLYSGGIAALAGEKYQTLAALLSKTTANSRASVGTEPLIYAVNTRNVIGSEGARLYAQGHQERVISYAMRNSTTAWTSLSQYITDVKQQNFLFDHFEYYLGLVYGDNMLESKRDINWAPRGSLASSWRTDNNLAVVQELLASQISSLGEEMPVLKAGLFGGSVERLQEVKQQWDEALSKPAW
jgi:hypothetical protein